MIHNLSSEKYRLQNATRLLNDIAANSYYFFVGDYLNHSNNSLQSIPDITSSTLTLAYRNMIQGKLFGSNSASYMINNVQWTSNTVYAMYDDIDANLPNEQFFIITTEGSSHHIWKCLYNNFNARSTVQPLFAQANTTPFYQTTDGYQWKYLTTIDSATASKFSTTNYFPIVANTATQQAAVPGTINAFVVESNGAFYNNYVASGTFQINDININGDPTLFNLSGNNISTTNGYYTGCILNITGGQGLGQFIPIVDYGSNSTGNIIKLQNAPFPVPATSTTYQIYPAVNIISDGSQTVNCVAIALINSLASNSVYRISPLNLGQNYQFVESVSVVANAVVAVTNTAIVRAIMSPVGGHGSHVYSELYCNSIGISVSLSNSEGNTILTTNDYQQIGILKNPLFANVALTLTGMNGLFQTGEVAFTYTSQQIDANATFTAGSSNVTCNTANFVNQVRANNYLILSSINGTNTQLVQVANVVNSSMITIVSNAAFSCTQGLIYSTTITANGIITVVGSNTITLTNCSPGFSIGGSVVGAQSGAAATITNIARNGVAKGFNTFIQLNKLDATLLQGSFTQDETLSQGNSSASLFAVTGSSNNITLYFNDVIGSPITTGQLTGANSGSTANVSTLYVPELIFGSAEILYLENISPVTRANNQTEAFQVIFNF